MQPPRHWDYVFTCYEPIGAVTGGIGTYTRLLLQLLKGNRDPNGRFPSVLFVTSARRNDPLPAWCDTDGFRVERVPEDVLMDGVQVHQLDDPLRKFGFNAMERLRELQAQGHSFGYLEVPDYNAEGFYLIKARRLGWLKFQRTAVRLHSPVIMLHADNDSRADAGPATFRTYEEEKYVYRHADDVLYGGDAMLERVLSHLEPVLRETVKAKAVKIPHPWPEPHRNTLRPERDGRIHVGYIGRLEYRKGVDLLVRAAVQVLQGGRRDVVFHFFGRDTWSFRGRSVRAHLDSLIPAELRDAFCFHDYVPQSVLWSEKLPKMDLFVFPSRFENYPNVLLEVLDFGRPVLVSQYGCMPEMGAGFPVRSIDPFDVSDFRSALEEVLSQSPSSTDVHARYTARRAELHRTILDEYSRLSQRKDGTASASATGHLPIAFVVTHFNKPHLLPALFGSLLPQLEPGDEVVVVDDVSSPEAADTARRVTEIAGAKFMQTPRNSGPSVARNLGAAATTSPLIYFVDGDDELVPGSVRLLRETLARLPEVEVTTGFLRAFADGNEVWAMYEPSPCSVLLQHSAHCGIVIRRETFKRVGGYQTEQRLHFEDWELTMRLTLKGVRFEVIPALTYRYRVDRQTGRSTTNVEHLERSREECLRHALSEGEPEQLAALRPLLISLMMRKPETVRVEHPPEALRYRLVDRLNGVLKQTPVHRLLKRTIEAKV